MIDAWVANAEREIVGAADAMPEEEYSFAPTQGEFRGVRTFAKQVTHLAAANYQLASAILHEWPPHGEQNETAPASVKTKAEVMEYVRGSFAYLHRAAATIASENAVTPIEGLTATQPKTRLGLVVDAVAHAYDHYGQMVEYLRMNGIVPPASRSK